MCIFIESVWCYNLYIVCRLSPCYEAMETPYLPRGLDALDDSQTDHYPSHQQGQGHLPVQAAGVVDGAGDVERLAVPEVSGGRALLTLWHHDCNSNKEREGNGINCADSGVCTYTKSMMDIQFGYAFYRKLKMFL